MNKIKQWLLKPYPLLEESSLKLALAFGLGLIVFLILVVFRPFGLASVESVTFLSGVGGITTLILLLHFFIFPAILPSHFSITNWSVYKQLFLFCSILLFILVLNYLYNSTIGQSISPQYGLLEFVWMTSTVGFVPIVLMTYVVEKVENSRNSKIANDILIEKELINHKRNLTIKSENQQDSELIIAENDFLYAQSSNNYCTIYYLANKLNKKILKD